MLLHPTDQDLNVLAVLRTSASIPFQFLQDTEI